MPAPHFRHVHAVDAAHLVRRWPGAGRAGLRRQPGCRHVTLPPFCLLDALLLDGDARRVFPGLCARLEMGEFSGAVRRRADGKRLFEDLFRSLGRDVGSPAHGVRALRVVNKLHGRDGEGGDDEHQGGCLAGV